MIEIRHRYTDGGYVIPETIDGRIIAQSIIESDNDFFIIE